MERQKRTCRVELVRPAFTLVELLVVITIIGMLMALLMPAISAAREQGRRSQCMNNEKQLGVALLSYEGSHKSFPGWQNWVAGAATPVSWLSMLLPNMERTDLWQKVKSAATTFQRRGDSVEVDHLPQRSTRHLDGRSRSKCVRCQWAGPARSVDCVGRNRCDVVSGTRLGAANIGLCLWRGRDHEYPHAGGDHPIASHGRRSGRRVGQSPQLVRC